MQLYTAIYKNTEAYVTELFKKYPKPELTLHNFAHTEAVVQKAIEIAGNYKLSEEDMLVLFVAAWFHDTGYLFATAAEHEYKSAEIVREFLASQAVSEEIVEKTAACIMATRSPRKPQNLLEEILCDADTFQFGDKESFKKTNKQAFAELHHQSGETLTLSHFNEGTLKMLEAHQFYTSYAKDLLNASKNKIIKKQKKGVEKAIIEKNEPSKNDGISEKDGTTKGMQTMLRLTSSNHIQLSEMADSKANILISVNAIIISVILSILLRKLQTDPFLTIPTIIFLASSVMTIVIAILATRPKVNVGTFEDMDIVNKKTNLLFFGNFHKMSLEHYTTAMKTMMKDPDYLYSSIIQDIFHLGKVLGKKYRLIRLAYNIFMVGIIVSVIAFSIASLLNTGKPETAVINSTGSPF